MCLKPISFKKIGTKASIILPFSTIASRNFPLTPFGERVILLRYFRCCHVQLKGNPVKFRNGPAAVTGDENHCTHCWVIFFQREGVTNKPIRKPENLPECLVVLPARNWADQHNVDKFGSHTRKISGMGFLLEDAIKKGQTTSLFHMEQNRTGNRWTIQKKKRDQTSPDHAWNGWYQATLFYIWWHCFPFFCLEW